MTDYLAGTKTNIKILAWLYIIPSVLGEVLGVMACLILMGVALLAGERTAAGVLLLVGWGSVGVTTLLCLPGLFVGWGLLRFKAWARVLTLGLGLLNLAAFPLGTVLAVYTFFSLLTPEASEVFAGS